MKANKPTKKAAPTTKTATTASAQGRRADGGVPASKFQLPHCAGSIATCLHGKTPWGGEVVAGTNWHSVCNATESDGY